VTTGCIIIKQRGTHILPGKNVRRAKDDTLFAMADGRVRFERVSREKQRVSVVPGA
jgi:large subunit ribosomal protein L27